LGRVNVDGKVGAVAHEVCVRRMMLDESAAEDDHARLLGVEGNVVDSSNVADNVHDKARVAVRVEVKHVAQRAVRDRRAVHGDVVLVRPVVDRVWMVDLLA